MICYFNTYCQLLVQIQLYLCRQYPLSVPSPPMTRVKSSYLHSSLSTYPWFELDTIYFTLYSLSRHHLVINLKRCHVMMIIVKDQFHVMELE